MKTVLPERQIPPLSQSRHGDMAWETRYVRKNVEGILRGRARYPFVATVRATDLESRVRLDGLTTDLSEGGCCVLTREPYSRVTRILLEIMKNGVSLLTRCSCVRPGGQSDGIMLGNSGMNKCIIMALSPQQKMDMFR